VRAREGGYGEGANTTGVVILQDDRLVGEWYAPGFGPQTPQRTWSVAKSLAGTVIGAAVQRGEVDVNAPAAIVDWSRPGDPRAAITLDNLMRMASGLTSDTAGNRTDALYFGGVGVDEQATTWPLIAAPGSRFRYANNDILLAILSLAPTFAEHPPAELFRTLGMYDTVAETDWRGNYILSSQVWSTARDLARFGQLYVDDGVVDGVRILPEGWRDYVSRPSGPQPRGEQGYGATFWLFDKSEGIPADAISANGNRGQYVIIVPSRRIVIVRRGEDPASDRFDHIAFTRDVLAALD
jgi:CubicO group peptidase (beta-lactamase class C family)